MSAGELIGGILIGTIGTAVVLLYAWMGVYWVVYRNPRWLAYKLEEVLAEEQARIEKRQREHKDVRLRVSGRKSAGAQ